MEDTAKKPGRPARKDIKFYFVESAKQRYIANGFKIVAEDHIYVLSSQNPKYKEILEFLRNRKDNKANGGKGFFELSGDVGEESSRGELIDKLIKLDIPQLRKACGGDPEYALIKTKGQLIDLYLKQQEI